MVFGALQSSGSHCCVCPLYLFDYDKLLPRLLLLEIRKMKAESDPAIDEYREVHGSKERFVSECCYTHSAIIWKFFSAC